MTKAEFIRWANRREKAADALREARRLICEMAKIDAPAEVATEVSSADMDTARAIFRLEAALNQAPTPAPTDNRTKER